MANYWTQLLDRKGDHLLKKDGLWMRMQVVAQGLTKKQAETYETFLMTGGKTGLLENGDMLSGLLNKQLSVQSVDRRVLKAGHNAKLGRAVTVWPCKKG